MLVSNNTAVLNLSKLFVTERSTQTLHLAVNDSIYVPSQSIYALALQLISAPPRKLPFVDRVLRRETKSDSVNLG